MNKLVIIGNGFDLAHGLKTSYKDFLLWYLNKRHGQNQSYTENALLSFVNSSPFDSQFESMEDFNARLKYKKIKVKFHFDFFEALILDFQESNWVDIESKFYSYIVDIYKRKVGEIVNIGYSDPDRLNKLNKCIEIIKSELEEYLSSPKIGEIKPNPIIQEKLYKELFQNTATKDKTMFLNFNYLSTINTYKNDFKGEIEKVNFVHGKLKDENNPIIFGYGDETDSYYEKIERLNDNQFLIHFKSFGYLKTHNYQNLFRFIESDDFEVYILGHSCGLSDRVLLSSIFERKFLKKIYIFHYHKKSGESDFFEKTQEISRHFKPEGKHRMRELIAPFSEDLALDRFY